VMAQYLIKGQFEYVLNGEPQPLCILPIGAVPNNTPPFWSLLLDCRYTNRFIDLWTVKYLSMTTLSLCSAGTVYSVSQIFRRLT
jgi:hypothetical protein